MSKNLPTVQAQHNGQLANITPEHVCNAVQVWDELQRQAPPGFVPAISTVTVSDAPVSWGAGNENPDLHKIKGGGVDYTWKFINRIMPFHGVEVVATDVHPMEVNGKPGLCVKAVCRRRRFGQPDEVDVGVVAESYEMAETKAMPRGGFKSDGDRIDVQRVMVRRLMSEAKKVAARNLLKLPKADERMRGGRMAFRTDVLDMTNPAMQRYAFERATSASSELYGASQFTEPGITQSDPEPVILDDAEFDDVGDGGEQARHDGDGTEATAQPSATPSRPAWVSSFAYDNLTGEINWESLPEDQLRAAIRKGIAEVKYDTGADEAYVIAAGQGGNYIDAARRLYAFQMGGGS